MAAMSCSNAGAEQVAVGLGLDQRVIVMDGIGNFDVDEGSILTRFDPSTTSMGCIILT